MNHCPAVPVRVAAAAAALACVVALSACENRTSEGESDPVAAARDFITAGVVDHNGFEACAYLTPKQQHAASRRAGGGECRDAFDDARLRLGRHVLETVHQVERLSASVDTTGNRARVRLARDGASIEFRLVKANFAEQEEFDPPDNEWRIAGGAPRLLRSAAHG